MMECQVLVRLDQSQTHVLNFVLEEPPDNNHDHYVFPSECRILHRLSQITRIPTPYLHLYPSKDGHLDKNATEQTLFRSAYTHIPIRGGKGGFGTLLKGQSKQAAARTTLDFGACRDLSGRRLRHVNDEILLRKWKTYQLQLQDLSQEILASSSSASHLSSSSSSQQQQEEQEEEWRRKRLEIELQWFQTESGLRNWNLRIPNWSEITGSGKNTHKYLKKQERQIKKELEESWKKVVQAEQDKYEQVKKREERITSYVHSLDTLQQDDHRMMQAIHQGIQKQYMKKYEDPLNEHPFQEEGEYVAFDQEGKEEEYHMQQNDAKRDQPKEEQDQYHHQDEDIHEVVHTAKKQKLDLFHDRAELSIDFNNEEEEVENSDLDVGQLDTNNENESTALESIWTLSGDFITQIHSDPILKTMTTMSTSLSTNSSTHTCNILLQSKSNFATACVLTSFSKKDHHNPYRSATNATGMYYEVVLETAGLAQLGWAWVQTPATFVELLQHSPESQKNTGMDLFFCPDSDSGNGVGDDRFSYGYDGGRGFIFHAGEEKSYGKKTRNPSLEIEEENGWKQGDVVGCLYDWNQGIIRYFMNGVDLGIAFQVHDTIHNDSENEGAVFPFLCPALSLNENEILSVNIGPIFSYSMSPEYGTIVGVCEFVPSRKIESKEIKETSTVNMSQKSSVTESEGTLLPSRSTTPIPLLAKNSSRTVVPSTTTVKDSKSMDPPPSSLPCPIDLENYQSAQELESLGLDVLKGELERLGCKCGGSLKERAERLFSVKGLKREEYPMKVRGKKFLP